MASRRKIVLSHSLNFLAYERCPTASSQAIAVISVLQLSLTGHSGRDIPLSCWWPRLLLHWRRNSCAGHSFCTSYTVILGPLHEREKYDRRFWFAEKRRENKKEWAVDLSAPAKGLQAVTYGLLRYTNKASLRRAPFQALEHWIESHT